MSWWRRGRSAAPTAGTDREEEAAAAAHLVQFARSRTGVEAYVEPPTAVLPRTVALVAADGEWTRRRLADDRFLRQLSDELALPVYDARITGYPQRMRDWTARQRRATG